MARSKDMDDTRLVGIVSGLVADAEDYRNDRSADRDRMMVFFDGDEKKLQQYVPAEEGRSHVVSRDVRAAVRKVLPSVLRTILGNDEIVEYQPVGEGDEDSAQQATDYVNYVALPECNGRQAIEDGINDAIRLRNGVIKWWLQEETCVSFSRHSGLDDMAFSQLVEDDEVEVLEHTERQVFVEVEGQNLPLTVHDLKIKRTFTKRLPTIRTIAPENFLIHSEATSFDDAILIGEHLRLRRSDLIRMGYDRDVIEALPLAGSGETSQEVEEDTRRRNVRDDSSAELAKATQEIDYYDLLVKLDYDQDGIAELRRIVFAGGLGEENLLENVEQDEINYANIISERRPHQWEGNSVSDEVMEVQKVKTVLLRQTLDNLYWQNNLQPIVQEGQVMNPEAVIRPKFGEPIRVAQGVDVRAAIGANIVPMVADKSYAMLEYMDREATDRTGISEASSGMAPDALQNMTAKATALVEQAGIGQTEMMVRCIAESLKPVFRGLLKLIIDNQDIPRTVRLRDEWVEFDPRSWNANMDAIVNVGLGAGTRERDMMMMQQVIGLQKEILSSMGPAVGMQYVTPDNVYNAIAKLVQAAGLKTVGLYFTKPDPQAIQQAMQAQSQQPSPEQIKAQTSLQVEQLRGQNAAQIEQMRSENRQQEFTAKMVAEANKEREQRDADLQVNMAELARESEGRRQQMVVDAQQEAERNQTEIDKALIHQQTEREWMQTQQSITAAKTVADIQKTQAAAIGKALDRQSAPEGNRQGRSGK